MAEVKFRMTPQTEDTLRALRMSGIRYNIVTPVERRLELYYAYKDLSGKEHTHFVCELDGYGGIAETGPYFPEPVRRNKNFVFNADGEQIKI